MGTDQLRQLKRNATWIFLFIVGFCWVFTGITVAQVDQGAIKGDVKDTAGAVVPYAMVTLTNTDMNFVLQDKADAKGQYIFSPIKIGHYTVSATAPKFATTTQENVTVNIQDVLNIPLVLKPGGVTENVTVTAAPPLLNNENGAVGQVMDTETINATPLNGRNWVYIAQLTAGVVPGIAAGGARGGGTGDFSANGQRSTQNNFILDGVDNNVNVDDFQNGASYNVRPPPDALAEFKIDTANYSAEFGHSSGAVLNASIKSGTNQIHGDLWEYVRNTKFDGADWDAGGVVPAYHQNQFGATLGGPLWKSKLFYFGDFEANRIAFAEPDPGLTVPTASTRTGDLSEYLLPSLNGLGTPLGVFAPNSGGQVPLTQGGGAFTNPAATDPSQCATPQLCAWHNDPSNPAVWGTNIGGPGAATTNVLTRGDVSIGGMVDTVTQEVMALYPKPNANGWNASNYSTPGSGMLYYNYNVNVPVKDDTFQWDQRLDWNPSAKDQAYARYSYTHEQLGFAPPLGPILDGGVDAPGGFHGATNFNLAENFMASVTHLYSPTLINEFRFGYNWGLYEFAQMNSHTPATDLIPGMGGVPFNGTASPNGGIPIVMFRGPYTDWVSFTGAENDVPSIERQNIYQLLDNLTKSKGRHSFKFGIQLESIRTVFSQPFAARGQYNFDGQYTEKADQNNVAVAHTNSGIADGFTDNQGNIQLSPSWATSYYRWYRSGYVQDDWKVSPKLTVNLGVRYEFVQPFSSKPGDLANFLIDDQHATAFGQGTGGGSAVGNGRFVYPAMVAPTISLSPNFISQLALDNITVDYTTSNQHSLISTQHYNFAPRIGLAYQLNAKTVLRTAYGMFHGGLESPAGGELQDNYPFQFNLVVDNQYKVQWGGCYPSYSIGYQNTNSQCPSNALPDYSVNDPNNPNGVGNFGPGAAGNNEYSTPVGLAPFPYATNIEIGGSGYLNAQGGITQFGSSAVVAMSQPNMKTPYTQSYNLTVERQITKDMVATVGYVGNNSKHSFAAANPFGALGIANPTAPSNPALANGINAYSFPGLYLMASQETWQGERIYNSLQTKLEKHFSDGLSFLATYTWAHAEADYSNTGTGGGVAYRDSNTIPFKDEMTNDNYDVRHRVTFNGLYDLPFGKGRRYMHQGGILDYLVGGWSASATWTAQTGIPFTVSTGDLFAPLGAVGEGQYNAIRIGDPFKGGGSPDPRNVDMAGQACPATVHNRQHWFNPCAFIDPEPGTSIPIGVLLTSTADFLQYSGSKANQIHGPGWERVNMSGFKNFKTWRDQYVQFRADAFNLFNTPSAGQPTATSLGPTAGLINKTQPFQNYTPDARFFQLAAKYVF